MRTIKIKKQKAQKSRKNASLFIYLVMETPENIDLLREFDQMLYAENKLQIKALCDKHNELISMAKSKKDFDLCLSIETTVNDLNDSMNLALDNAFKEVLYIFDDEIKREKRKIA